MARDINALHPVLQDKISQLKELCKKNGLNIGIGECLRTVSEQDALYAKGRTTSGNIVTNAKGSSYSSQHQWGVAFDFFKNVKGHEFDDISFFNDVAALAKSIGLAWGGDWTSIKDRPHLYLPDWGSTTKKLKEKYQVPDKFKATWGGSNANSSTTTPTAPNTDSTILGVNKQMVQGGQIHSNNFTGANITADGIRGRNTIKAGIMVWQTGMNKDYNSGLKVDGIAGAKTNASMSKKTVRKGDTGYMVTALEILLMLKGYNPNGVECPGKFGDGLEKAVKQYQDSNGLVVDGIAGINTFKSLIE